MSTSEPFQYLRLDIHNELITANQLLRLISIEVQKIKELTAPGSILDVNIKENAKLVASLANKHQMDLTNLPSVTRTQLDIVNQSDQHLSCEQHDTFRNNMNDSQ